MNDTTADQMRKDAEAARKAALEKSQEVTERIRKDGQERLSKGKPTPTQEENDRFALGEHIMEHEDDGSGPEEHVLTRSVEAKRPSPAASYQTRAATPQRPSPAPKSE